MLRVKNKVHTRPQGIVIVIVICIVTALLGTTYLSTSVAQKEISISLVDAADVTESLRNSYRVVCKFTYEVKNQLEEEAFIGPFTMKVANARLPVAIAAASIGSGERYSLSAKGLHKLPCSSYRMDPWLEVHKCSTTSGLNCSDAIAYQISRKKKQQH